MLTAAGLNLAIAVSCVIFSLVMQAKVCEGSSHSLFKEPKGLEVTYLFIVPSVRWIVKVLSLLTSFSFASDDLVEALWH